MEEDKPIAAINPQDITTITHILMFYERWLTTTTAPSAKRSKQIAEVQFLLVKISMLGTSKMAALTYNEVDYISAAIRVFISQARTKIPQSQNREEVLESLEQLRHYFVTVFAPKQA